MALTVHFQMAFNKWLCILANVFYRRTFVWKRRMLSLEYMATWPCGHPLQTHYCKFHTSTRNKIDLPQLANNVLDGLLLRSNRGISACIFGELNWLPMPYIWRPITATQPSNDDNGQPNGISTDRYAHPANSNLYTHWTRDMYSMWHCQCHRRPPLPFWKRVHFI